MQNGWKVYFVSYSSIDYQIGDTSMDPRDARKEAAEIIRARRRCGFTVTKIDKGRWEVQKTEQGGMVLDTEGYIILREPRAYDCRECGCDFIPDEYERGAWYKPVCEGCLEDALAYPGNCDD
jgi:hypothetical protein